MTVHGQLTQSTTSTNLADLLERILDKGVVIAGDIRVNLVEIELLTIQLRLVICSVDKAREMGIDWWTREPRLAAAPAGDKTSDEAGIAALNRRLDGLERVMAARDGAVGAPIRQEAS